MADILLSVGLQHGVADIGKAQSDLQSLLHSLEKTEPKIKVGLEIDPAALESFRAKLQGVLNSISTAKGAPITINIDGLGRVSAEAKEAEAALKEVTAVSKEVAGAARTAGEAQSEMAVKSADSSKKIQKDTTEYLKALQQVDSKLGTVRANLDKWNKARTGKSSTAYKEYKDEAAALENLRTQLETGSLSAKEFKNEMAKIGSGTTTAANSIKAAGENTQTFVSRLKQSISQMSVYFNALTLVMYGVRAVKNMVKTMTELDTSLTQLKIVTGASDAQMEQFLEKSISLSQELGKSITEVTKSVETFSRLGYNLGDASELTKFATIMSNVAGVTQETATTGLTSIIKGYGLDVTDAEHVADVLIEVGQKYAVSAGELMEAYEKSGAALNAANTSFEKSAALIAAANASVQDASTVGTALKTISARMRKSESELVELGESTEDLVEGFSKYADEVKQLTGVDILVSGTTDTFRDLYDIFNDIAAVWDKLSDTKQARVAEIFGGTRQLQVISSILTNWGDAVGAYEYAMDSAGVSAKANATYMESIEAHLNQLKATYQEFANTFFSNDFVNKWIDAAKTLLSWITSLTDAIGSFGTLGLAVSGIAIFKNFGSSIEFAHDGCDPIAA